MNIKEYCESQIGCHQRYTLYNPDDTVKTVVEGIVDKYELSGKVILDTKTGEVWPAYYLRIKPLDGSRAVWTKAFPFKEKDHA